MIGIIVPALYESAGFVVVIEVIVGLVLSTVSLFADLSDLFPAASIIYK